MLSVIAQYLDRTQRSTFKASSVPQLIRSVRGELIGVCDELSIQGIGYDREALAETIDKRLVVFMQRPIHLLIEWLDPATYMYALQQKQCERNMADLCLREIVDDNIELRSGSSVKEILSAFAHFKDGAWRGDLHTLMSELKILK